MGDRSRGRVYETQAMCLLMSEPYQQETCVHRNCETGPKVLALSSFKVS